MTDGPSIRCSFCSKTQAQVRRLVAGPGVYICDECADLVHEIMLDDFVPPGTPGWRYAAGDDGMRFRLVDPGEGLRSSEEQVYRVYIDAGPGSRPVDFADREQAYEVRDAAGPHDVVEWAAGIAGPDRAVVVDVALGGGLLRPLSSVWSRPAGASGGPAGGR